LWQGLLSNKKKMKILFEKDPTPLTCVAPCRGRGGGKGGEFFFFLILNFYPLPPVGGGEENKAIRIRISFESVTIKRPNCLNTLTLPKVFEYDVILLFPFESIQI
jgi:hypothetical protein